MLGTMKVLLLLTLAVVGQCALLGSRKCTYGPSYWCSHLHHAKECNAVQHCMSTVWKKQKLDSVTGWSDTCSDVIKVLDVVRRSTDDDFTEQWVVGCTGMPLEKRQICKELAANDMNEVYKLLRSDLSSRQIAGALNLCGGFEDTVPHPGQGHMLGDDCKDCVNFIGDLVAMIKRSEGEFKNLTKDEICTQLGSFEQLCDQLVDQYADFILDYIMQGMKPEAICRVLQMCTGQARADLMVGLTEMMTKQQWGTIECDLCKTTFQAVQGALGNPTFQSDVFAMVNAEVCSHLGSFAKTCQTLVDSLGPVLFKSLVVNINPEFICQVLHVCPSQAPLRLLGSIRHMQKLGSAECDVCKTVVQDAENELKDPNVQSAVLNFLKNDVCSELGSFADQCKTYVDSYGPLALEFLVQELNPQTVCQALHVCTSQAPVDLMERFRHHMLAKQKLGSPAECDDCKTVVQDVQNELKDPNVQSAILNFLKNDVCSKLGSLADQCKSYVDSYGPIALELLVQEMDPLTVCQALHVCTSQAPVDLMGRFKQMLAKQKLGSIECDACKAVVQDADNELKDPNVQSAVLNFLKNDVCSKLGSFADKCQTYVDSYGPLALEFLVQNMNPQTVCQALHVCTSQAPVDLMERFRHHMLAKHKSGSPAECDACKTVVQDVQNELKDPNVQSAILNFLKNDVCSKLGSFADQCNSYVDSYGPMALDLLVQELDPQTVCQELHVCSSQTPVHLVSVKQKFGSVECDACKMAVQDAENELKDPNVQSAVVNFLKNDMCSKLGSFADKCKTYVDSYVPMVLEFIVQELDPLYVCQTLHVCTSHARPDLMNYILAQRQRSNGAACDVCKDVVQDAQNALKDTAVQNAILTFLSTNVCGRMGGFADKCKSIVESYGPVVLDMLVTQLTPQEVCQTVHLCSGHTQRHLLKDILAKYQEQRRIQGVIECDVCKDAAKEVQGFLRESSVQDDVLAFLENDVCKILGSFATECQSYVSTYGPMAFEVLVAELDPETICTTLGFCNAATSGKVSHVHLGSPMGTVQILQPEKKVDDPITCELCKELISELKKVIGNKGKAEAEKALEDMCNHVPRELYGECIRFVETYGDEFINFVFEELSPELVCSKIHECPSAAFLQAVGLQVAAKSEKCDICEDVIEYVKEQVNSSKARTFEKEMLERACTATLAKYGWLCGWFVNKYAPAIINLFEEKVDPAQICSVMDLCGKAQSPAESHPLKFQPMLELQPARPHLLGTKECLYGPSFWCASERNARLCQAEGVCRRLKEEGKLNN